MKTLLIYLILLAIIFLLSCNLTETIYTSKWTKGKQIVPGNDSLIPDSIKAWLKEDASRLALRDVHSDLQSKPTLITLPQELVDFYYHGLVHTYNAVTLAARDSVFNIYKIHSFRRPEQRSILVVVDSTKNWVNNWRHGQRLTGNLQIDSLVNKYDLQLINYYAMQLIHAAVLESSAPINIFALGKKFQTIDGVLFAEENRTVGDGDDINALIESDYLKIEFSKGWNDCPAGCIYRHYWAFTVMFNGTVSFSRSFGDLLP